MAGVVSMRVEAEEIISAVRRMKPQEREAFLEDLLAAISPKYLEIIREARRDYKSGRIKSHVEVFKRRIRSDTSNGSSMPRSAPFAFA